MPPGRQKVLPSPIIFFLKLRYEANQVVQWGCGQAANFVGCAVVP
jgi:hypothetical protein